jgi:collagenase-like PrtC family protease
MGHDLTWGNSSFTRTVMTREFNEEDIEELDEEKDLVDA